MARKPNVFPSCLRHSSGHGKPTWITINGDSEQYIENRLGSRIYDRLRQNAWVIHCDWASRRKPRAIV